MQLPVVREKLSSLPRKHRILLAFIVVLAFVLAVEFSYYYFVVRERLDELKYINADNVYQEGVFLYDKTTKEPIAIRGRVISINGLLLTIENQREKILVEMEEEFEFAKIDSQPKLISDSPEPSNLNQEEQVFDLEEQKERRGLEEGFLASSEILKTDSLDQVLRVDDFVVISKLEPNFDKNEPVKGKFLSVLVFLRS
jgi:hypothetical protein